MIPDSLKVIAAQIRNNIIGLALTEAKEYDELSQEDTLALIAYINNRSDEEFLALALSDWINANELSENMLSTLRNHYQSLVDLPF